MSKYKNSIKDHYNNLAPVRRQWIEKNSYYYDIQTEYYKFLIPEGKRILEVGCGTGELLAKLKPSYGVGIDISCKMIDEAKIKYRDCTFITGDIETIVNSIENSINDENNSNIATDTDSVLNPSVNKPFDYIILSDLVGLLEDVQTAFDNLHQFCKPETRIIIAYYNTMWEPVLTIAEKFKMKMSNFVSNWLSPGDIKNLLLLSDLDSVKEDRRVLVPKNVPFLNGFFSLLGTLPLINRISLCNYIVARPFREKIIKGKQSVSVVVPCKNERGNIEPLVKRLPDFGSHVELIFIDGHSMDGTQEEIKRVIKAYPEKDIKFLIQDGKGKGDAVRKAFAYASNDILTILDADMTVAPEDLPKFYNALVEDKGEFINGCRLVYPMENEAMRFLNILGNKFFSYAFSWLLNQRIKDTLCGTKVLYKKDYNQIVANRAYFGDFDPFGDFDLLFGASKLNLKIIEVPVRYNARSYGQTQISRFRHGLLLLKMTFFAVKKLKMLRR